MKGKNAARRGGSVPLLALSNVACRVLGFLFKVPLSNLVGSVGMGYFALATQVFGVAAVPATGGMPVILSADAARRQQVRQKYGC